MKVVRTILLILAALVLLTFVIGSVRPAEHTARIEFELAVPDTVLWATVADFENTPTWFPGVSSVQRLADIDGRPAYREVYDGFPATVVVRELTAPTRIVRDILPSGSFSGTWTIELRYIAGGTGMSITEFGRVGNPFFRAMMIFHDNTATIRAYAEALAARHGAQPRAVVLSTDDQK